jgi:hypothetical protein
VVQSGVAANKHLHVTARHSGLTSKRFDAVTLERVSLCPTRVAVTLFEQCGVVANASSSVVGMLARLSASATAFSFMKRSYLEGSSALPTPNAAMSTCF